LAVDIADVFHSHGAASIAICDAARLALLGGFGVFGDSSRWQRLFLSKRKKHVGQCEIFIDVPGRNAALSGSMVCLADAVACVIPFDFDPSFWSVEF
jgi:hypothetical protein